jgi:peptide/nickel transport system permease protein
VNASVDASIKAGGDAALAHHGKWLLSLRRFLRQPVAVAALTVVLVLFIAGALAPEIVPQGWNSIDLSSMWRNHGPALTGGHLMGTDNIGRDTIVRTLWGLHYSEQNALLGALLATLLGIAIGGLAGYYRGWPDTILMRAADLVTGFPVFVLMLITFSFLRPVTVWKATFVFTFYMWTLVARPVRARFLAIRTEEFIDAAIAAGASDRRIFLRHLLPNAAGVIIVAASGLVGQIILVEATVEFFGFGVSSLLRPTLGNLIGDATSTGIGPYNYLGLGSWVWATPATVLAVTLVCLNLLGDGLDEALNPRTTRRR